MEEKCSFNFAAKSPFVTFWPFITNSSGRVFDECILLLTERKCFQMNLESLVLVVESEKYFRLADHINA